MTSFFGATTRGNLHPATNLPTRTRKATRRSSTAHFTLHSQMFTYRFHHCLCFCKVISYLLNKSSFFLEKYIHSSGLNHSGWFHLGCLWGWLILLSLQGEWSHTWWASSLPRMSCDRRARDSPWCYFLSACLALATFYGWLPPSLPDLPSLLWFLLVLSNAA